MVKDYFVFSVDCSRFSNTIFLTILWMYVCIVVILKIPDLAKKKTIIFQFTFVCTNNTSQ